MAISKSKIGQHKRMAMGDLSVGFKSGGHVTPFEKKMEGMDDELSSKHKKGGKGKGKKR